MGICAYIEMILEHVPTIPIVKNLGGQDYAHASILGYQMSRSPFPIRSHSTLSHQMSRFPSPADVGAMPDALSTFPSTFDLLLPSVSCAHFKSIYSSGYGLSSSQHILVSTPAAIKDDRSVPEEIQVIPKYCEGIVTKYLNQMTSIEPLDNVPHVELNVDCGCRRGLGRACGHGRGRRGRGRS